MSTQHEEMLKRFREEFVKDTIMTNVKLGERQEAQELENFFIREIDLAVAEREKEMTVKKIEVWMPCLQGFGTAIKNDGSEMKLCAMIVGSNIIYLEKDFYVEIAELPNEDADRLSLISKNK